MAYIGRKRSVSELLSTADNGGRNEKLKKLEIYEKGRNVVSHSGTTKETKTCIPRLSEEIIFNILIFIPADILYNVMRHVCPQWSKIIQDPVFINEHLLHSNFRILLKVVSSYCEDYLYSVEMWKSDVRITSDKDSLLRTQPLATCSGLFLVHHREARLLLVRNPITRQELAVPRVSDCFWSGMAYASSSRVFKVINVSIDTKDPPSCAIISVGIDEAWRQLDTKSLSPLAQKLLHCHPYSAGGSLHWRSNAISFILTLDAETEAFQLHPLPESCDYRKNHYLVMGNSFSFLNYRSRYLWEVWVLVEKGIGSWMKLDSIDLQGQKDMLDRFCPLESKLFPIGWLRNGEVIVFGVTSLPREGLVWSWTKDRISLDNCIVYDVKTGKINCLELNGILEVPRFLSHLSTLISPKGI